MAVGKNFRSQSCWSQLARNRNFGYVPTMPRTKQAHRQRKQRPLATTAGRIPEGKEPGDVQSDSDDEVQIVAPPPIPDMPPKLYVDGFYHDKMTPDEVQLARGKAESEWLAFARASKNFTLFSNDKVICLFCLPQN